MVVKGKRFAVASEGMTRCYCPCFLAVIWIFMFGLSAGSADSTIQTQSECLSQSTTGLHIWPITFVGLSGVYCLNYDDVNVYDKEHFVEATIWVSMEGRRIPGKLLILPRVEKKAGERLLSETGVSPPFFDYVGEFDTIRSTQNVVRVSDELLQSTLTSDQLKQIKSLEYMMGGWKEGVEIDLYLEESDGSGIEGLIVCEKITNHKIRSTPWCEYFLLSRNFSFGITLLNFNNIRSKVYRSSIRSSIARGLVNDRSGRSAQRGALGFNFHGVAGQVQGLYFKRYDRYSQGNAGLQTITVTGVVSTDARSNYRFQPAESQMVSSNQSVLIILFEEVHQEEEEPATGRSSNFVCDDRLDSTVFRKVYECKAMFPVHRNISASYISQSTSFFNFNESDKVIREFVFGLLMSSPPP